MSLRVLLADDHALVRAGLKLLIEQMPGVDSVAEAADGRQALRIAQSFQPELALVNISMPELSGLEATQQITQNSPRTRVLVVSLHADPEYVRRAFAMGASGYLLKGADPAELPLAVRAVIAGDSWLSPPISRMVLNNLRRGEPMEEGVELLTTRQREVLQLAAEGHSTKEIAHRLCVSPKTVESHRAALMRRLDVHSVASLVRWAIRLGLVPAQL